MGRTSLGTGGDQLGNPHKGSGGGLEVWMRLRRERMTETLGWVRSDGTLRRGWLGWELERMTGMLELVRGDGSQGLNVWESGSGKGGFLVPGIWGSEGLEWRRAP